MSAGRERIVGVLGGGQLGRMLALAAVPLGLRVRFLEPAADPPVAGLGEVVQADFEDAGALAAFASGLSAATFEFENVPARSVRWLGEHVPTHPSGAALEVSQDRLSEKTLFHRLGIPTPRFVPVDSLDALRGACADLGWPCVLKTRRFGYDGKGQQVLRGDGDALAAWESLGGVPLIAEQFVPFERELSMIAVRGLEGQTAFYPLVQNEHRAGILRCSIAPAPATTGDLEARARAKAGMILEALEYTGVLAVEFFQFQGRLLASEIAPRVHNSGHWTIEGAVTSQFENHLRAILGLPLGSTEARGYSAMVNLIGRTPEPRDVLAVPGAHLHLYGKEPRPGRKLGHITVTSPSAEALAWVLPVISALADA
jgi:5-(carboxyamino)imidazole ribonucleotide synthase